MKPDARRWFSPPCLAAMPMLLFGFVVFQLALLQAAPLPGRPVPAKGDAARRLVVYTATRAAYSLSDDLEALKLHLRRVDAPLDAVSAAEVTSSQIAAASHLVVFCPQPEPTLGTNLLGALAATNRPVLWVGHGAELLTNLPALSGRFRLDPTASRRLLQVNYRGRDWPVADAYWIPMPLTTGAKAEIILRPAPSSEGGRLAIAWRSGHVTVFSSVPAAGLLGFLFSDLLLDFHGERSTSSNRVFFRIDDYQATSNHREFKRLADFLASRGHPFILSVTPSWRNPTSGRVEDLDSAPEFVSGLRHAQACGGRIVLRGVTHEPTGHGEFWDLSLDRPPASERPEAIREGIHKAVVALLKHGLLPLAWKSPDDAASSVASRELAQLFSTTVGRPQLSDATHLEKALLPALTVDRFGRQIVPENLGYVPASAADGLDAIKSRAEFLLGLRGTVAGCFIHAYQPLEKYNRLVSMLEETKAPFLDLAALDNWVHVPGYVLLTGRAQRRVKLAGGIMTWKAFDRNGRVIATEQEFAIAGERTLERKGKGDIELYEFRETIP